MSIFTYNGTSYEVISTAKTWVEAKSYAESNNGYLAIITSQAENDAIISNALNYLSGAPSASDGGNAKYVWIGGSDIATEGTFKWVDNSNVSAGFANWGSGFITEPDDFEGQDALAMGLEPWPAGGGGIGTAGKWNDIDENNLMYFVVEYNSTEVIPQESSVTTTLSAETVALKLIGTQKINGTGNALNNTITGNVAANVLSGLAGNDTLDGGLGNDTLVGGVGNDTYYVDAIKDKVTEKANEGTDAIIASISQTLIANVENLSLSGTSAINGTGNTVSNIVVGNDAANSINGGLGNDTLTGGTGNDTFVFNTKLGPINIDTITDFTSGTDKIAIDDAIFTKLKNVKNLSDNLYIQRIPGIGTQGTKDYLFYDFESGQLYYDADGSGTRSAAVMIAIIGSATEIAATDFMII
jgi:Ca2+-binding RTX toxin-like protein